MNFVRLYIGDYLRDTGTLSVAEHGAYMLMLMHYYATEKPLPVGRELHRLLRAESKAERDAIDSVCGRFWTETGSGLVNQRADREIERAERQREVNRTTGRLGGRPKRTETESVTEPVSESEPNCKRTETLVPDTRHHKEKYTPPSGSPLAAARPKSRGLRLPADWSPGDDGIAFAEAQGLRNGRAGKELDRFRDYWTSQPGQKGVKADWPATWRNWVRKAVETIPKSAASDDVFAGSH